MKEVYGYDSQSKNFIVKTLWVQEAQLRGQWA